MTRRAAPGEGQMTLGSPTLSPPAPPATSDPSMGGLLRDRGMRLVDAHVDPEWRELADQAIRDYAASGQEFTVEEIRAQAGDPDHPNAWGARFNAAAVGGLIVEVGRRRTTRTKRRAGKVTVWRGTEKARLT